MLLAAESTHGHGTIEGLPISDIGLADKAFNILAAFGAQSAHHAQSCCGLITF